MKMKAQVLEGGCLGVYGRVMRVTCSVLWRERGQTGHAGGLGSPNMALDFLRPEVFDKEGCGEMDRGQLVTFWAVVLTLCTGSAPLQEHEERNPKESSWS